MCTGPQDGCVLGGVKVYTGPQDVVCQGVLPFSIDVKGRDNVVVRGVMIAAGVHVLPSMPKGEIVDQRLSLMSTQAAPGDTPILHGNFDLPNYYILGQECF